MTEVDADRPPLIGRHDELALLRQSLDGARGGHGRVVLVAGEIGIGKSRLLDEVAAHATAAGAVVLAGRAVQGGGAYRALTEALLGLLRGGAVGR